MLKNKDRLTLSVKSKTWTRDSKRLFRLIPCYIWTWGSRWVIPRKDQPFADVPGLTMKFFHVWASYRATKTLKWIQTASAATLITNHWSPEIKEASLDHLELHSVSVKVILFSPNFGLVRLPELSLSLVEMFRTNLRIPVPWRSRHAGVPPRFTNMAARKYCKRLTLALVIYTTD